MTLSNDDVMSYCANTLGAMTMGWFYTPDGKPAFHALTKRRFEEPSESESSLLPPSQETAMPSTDSESQEATPSLSTPTATLDSCKSQGRN